MQRAKLMAMLALLPLLMVVMVAQAEQGEPRSLLRLQAGTFDPLRDGEPTAATAELEAAETEPYYIVQFNGPVEQAWADQVAQLGAELIGYLPDNAYIARIAAEDLPKVQTMYAVRWVGPYRGAYKVAPGLSRGGHLAADSVELVVVAFPGEPAAALERRLNDLGATIHELDASDLGVVARVSMSAADVPELSQYSAVSWIEPYIEPQMYNTEARKVMGAAYAWQDAGLYGADQIVAVADSGLSVQGALNADFSGRLVRAYTPAEMNPNSPACRTKTNWTDLNGHGTHVAGSVLGNGRNSGSNPSVHQYSTSFAGVAPEAKLVFMALNTDGSASNQCVPYTNANFLAYGYQNGARIATNSWGHPTGGTSAQQPTYGAYDWQAQLVDAYLWQNRDYLVLFAAGNVGPGADSIGSPGLAKNVLTVGASENYRPEVAFNRQLESRDPARMIEFSSRGPTDDGRVKPEIVAPGTSILSVRAERAAAETVDFFELFQPQPTNVRYAYSRGTSMATPLTAGAAALAREWLVTQRGVANPSAALLKALLIHGAFQLPGAITPSMNSGWGRVDLKNTLDSVYAIFDDNLQGLSTGQRREYTIQVAGSSTMGTLFAEPEQPDPAAATTLELVTLPAPTSSTTLQQTDTLTASLTLVPGYDTPLGLEPISNAADTPRETQAPLPRDLPQIDPRSVAPLLTSLDNGAALETYLQSMVGGGDFEDPEWTDVWSKVWLGAGLPVRTSAGNGLVLRGSHSIWLGGTPSDDMISYPLSFPRTLDSTFPSTLSFLVDMRNADPGYDYFCVALTDATGNIIGSGSDQIAACGDDLPSGIQSISMVLNANQRQALAGQTGYLNLLTFGDQITPHMSAFIDDISLSIDVPNVTLQAVPDSGPAGTTFLLSGSNNVPYGAVAVCVNSCRQAANRLGTVYADARGDIKAYLQTSASIAEGRHTLETMNVAGRTAHTSYTIMSETQPTLSVEPEAGPAGTAFIFQADDLLPGDSQIFVRVNGQPRGTLGSDASGKLSFRLNTSSNTPAGIYQVSVTDSAGRSVTASFRVTAVSNNQPQMSVAPSSGAPGTTFTFSGSGFAAAQQVSFTLDNQPIGSLAADAQGDFKATLTTADQTPPGSYTLTATQGQHQATAAFQITASNDQGEAPSGSGIYATLVWTDPPAQPTAAQTLVNNLNLRIEGPGGPYYGNGGRGADSVNNTESIRIDQPAAGTYTVIVEAARVSATYGAQPYALVVTTAQNYTANGSNTSIKGEGEAPPVNQIYLPLIRR